MARLVHEPGPFVAPVVDVADPLGDDDLHVTLYALYELHYRGFVGVDDRWEWEPSLLTFRAALERAFVDALTAQLGPVAGCPAGEVEAGLRAVIAASGGPSLSSYMETHGTLDQMREFAIHRSAYQQKEADPHTFGIPRLAGEAKAAFVEIQADEYGNGRLAEMHSELFAETMRALGLDTTYGAYLDVIPGVTLATVNLVSMFGLHRRWRGALVGHLAVFEMCSVTPMGRYSRALERLGVGGGARSFYDVHVVADAVHEKIASTRLAAGFARSEPAHAGDVLWGARALMAVEERFARHLLDRWTADDSSLRDRAGTTVAA